MIEGLYIIQYTNIIHTETIHNPYLYISISLYQNIGLQKYMRFQKYKHTNCMTCLFIFPLFFLSGYDNDGNEEDEDEEEGYSSEEDEEDNEFTVHTHGDDDLEEYDIDIDDEENNRITGVGVPSRVTLSQEDVTSSRVKHGKKIKVKAPHVVLQSLDLEECFIRGDVGRRSPLHAKWKKQCQHLAPTSTIDKYDEVIQTHTFKHI